MAGRKSDQIDAISVGIGLNLQNVRGQMRLMQGEIRRATAQEAIRIPIKLDLDLPGIQTYKRQLQKQLQGGPAIEVPVQLGTMRVNSEGYQHFRRNLERQLKVFSQNGRQGIQIPISVTQASLNTFRQTIEREFAGKPIEVEVVARRHGGGGGAPPTGGGGAPTPRSTPPAGGGGGAAAGPAPAGPAPAAGPTPARQRTASHRAQTTAAPAGGRARTGAEAAAEKKLADLEKAADRLDAINKQLDERERAAAAPAAGPAAGPRVVRRATTTAPRQHGPAGSRAIRKDDREQARMEEHPYTSTNTLRGGRAEEELPYGSEERIQASRPARPTRAQNWGEQAGERHMVTVRGRNGQPIRVSRIRPGASRSAHVRQEEMAQSARRKAREEFLASPQVQALPRDEAGRLDIAAIGQRFTPEFAEQVRAFQDPEVELSQEQLYEARRTLGMQRDIQYGATGREGSGRKGRTAIRRARRIAAGKVGPDAMTPAELVTSATIQAVGAEIENLQDPMARVRSGDLKANTVGRGFRVGGRQTGRMASMNVDTDEVKEIKRRRRIGGKGNSLKAMSGEFSAEAISQVRSWEMANKDKPEVQGLDPEAVYPGGAQFAAEGTAPSIQGGQGMTRKSGPAIAAETSAARERARKARIAGEAAFGPAPVTRANAGPLTGAEHPLGTGSEASVFAGGQRVRKPPPQVMGQAIAAAPQARTGPAFGGGGLNRLFNDPATLRVRADDPKEFLSSYRGALRGTRGAAGTSADRVIAMQQRRELALRGLAKSGSPSAQAFAMLHLQKLGVGELAEGGILHFDEGGGRPPWDLVKAFTRHQGPAPRIGSKLRAAREAQYYTGMRNRAQREKKPRYQQGGGADPKHTARAKAQLARQPWCASCGKRLDLVADHITDVASGGDVYGPLQTLCRSCNSRKGGGKTRRDIATPFSQHPPEWVKRKQLAEGGGWDPPEPPKRNLSAYQYPDDYRPMGRGKGEHLDYGSKVPKAPSDAPDWFDYLAKPKGRAEGGTYKAGGLLDRMAQAGHQPSLTMVGERGPELIVTGENGDSEVVPTHKVPTWLQRAREGHGLAKDMTHRVEGGAAPYGRSIRPQGGGGGTFSQRMSVASSAAQDAGAASSVRGIQQVAVVNWPPSLTQAGFGQAAAAGAAAAPTPGGGAAPGATPPGAAGTPPGPPPGMPGAGTPGFPGLPTAGAPSGRSRVDPLQRIEARRAGAQQTEVMQMRLDDIRSKIGESLQNAPVRALSVAMGQIAQTAVGGRAGILQRAGVARRQVARAGREVTQLEGLEGTASEKLSQLRELRAGGATRADPQVDQLRRELADLRGATTTQRGVVAERTKIADEAAGGILSRGQQFRAQAVGLGGIIGGTKLFTAAIQATDMAAQAAAAALSPMIDELLGFPSAIDKVTVALRDAITSSRGDVRGGIAGALAPSGVTTEFLDRMGGGLTRSATARAAQQSAETILDITRAATGNARTGNTRDRGVFEGTGGLFGGNIATAVFGGQEGFLQTIEKQFAAGVNTGPADRATYEAERSWLEQNRPAMERAARGEVTGVNAESFARVEGSVKAFEEALSGTNPVIEQLNKQLLNAAEYAGDASSAFEFSTATTQANTDAMIDSARAYAEATGDWGAVTRAEGFRDKGVTVQRRGGGALRGTEFGESFVDQLAQGQLIQDPRMLLRATERQRRAQAFRMQRQFQDTMREDLPAQFAFERIAQPPQPFGAGISMIGASAQTQREMGGLGAQAAEYSAGADAAEAEGRKALMAIVAQAEQAGPDRIEEFSSLLDEIEKIGKERAGMQLDLSMKTAAYDGAQYAEQMRLATRSLADASDFAAALAGDTINTVGGLQGQNALLDRQNQLLGRRQQKLSFRSEDIGFKSSDLQYQLQQMQFAQTQRQINFSKATARFTAPGDTPQERYARIQQARIEAAEAQKQLNLQRRIAAMAREQLQISRQQAQLNRAMFRNQVSQQDNTWAQTKMEAQRAIVDINKQLNLMARARQIEIKTKGIDQLIEKADKTQNRLIKKAEAFVTAGQEMRGTIIDGVTQAMEATGKGWQMLVTDVNKAWNEMFKGYEANVEALYPGSTGGGGGGQSAKTQAEGGIHKVTGATRFIAGEAGTESVIVIRNPQEGMMSMPMGGGGGGGTSIVINVTGNTVRDDRDLDNLIFRIKREINKDAALIGARRNF